MHTTSNSDPAPFADVRVLIFDLDGTLIDSAVDLALSVNATLKEMGRAPLPHDQIFGGNSFETKKPNPAGMGVLLRDFGAAPKQVMLVGDSEVDVQTARNAGTWVCCVTYGLGNAKLANYPPDLLVHSLTELAAHL